MAIIQTSVDISYIYKNFSLLKIWIKNVIELEKFLPGDISIIFTSDEYLLSLNRNFLKKDYFTDIITFNYNDGRIISGDLFISIDRVKDNSISYKQKFNFELDRVILHGILHLIGYNDNTDEEIDEMRSKESFYLKSK